MSTEKQPGWIRALSIILGIIVLIFGLYMLVYPSLATLTINFILTLALLLLGIALISIGRSATENTSKMALTGAGILLVIFGIIGLAMPQIVGTLMIAFIALGMLILGVGLLVSGIYGKATSSTILGIIILILAIIIIGYPAVGQYMIAIMLAIILILGGIANIVSGITGK
jgi:uncharacterized membrane protein HdeD (DUF308 family)